MRKERTLFTAALARALDKRGMTQGKLADIVGVTHSAMSHYATGKSIPKAITLYRICDVLDLDIASLTWAELEEERRHG